MATLIAQRAGKRVSEEIEKYGITKEKDLVEIAKIAAQQDGGGTSKCIKNYGIEKKEARIEIAKLAAQQDGWGVSIFIKNYSISEQKDLIEIAKIAVQQNVWGASRYIKNYGIEKEEDLIEIAKLAAQQDGWGVSLFIKNYSISEQKDLIEIAKIAVQQNGWGTSRYIKKYGIEKEADRIEIAKLAAQQDGWGVSIFIKNYSISEQKDLIEIAKIAVQQNGRGASECIQNYGIEKEEDLIEIARLAVQKNAWGVFKYIENYEIRKEEARIGIAKLVAQQNGWGASEYIKKYGIRKEEDRIAIAKIAAQQDGEGVSIYIKNYDIKDQKALIEIAYLAIQESILRGSTSDFWSDLSNYDLSEKELKKIQLLYASHYGLDNIENRSLQEFIDKYTKSIKFPSFTTFEKKITEIEKQISIQQDLHKLEKLQKKKQRTSLCFSLILNKYKFLSKEQQNYFIKALEYSNRKESFFLMQTLSQIFENANYFSKYQELIDSKRHLILPMIFINQWLIESPSLLNDMGQSELKQITALLKARKERKSLRNFRGFLPHLLQSLISLSHFSAISSEQKLYLLNQCLQAVLLIEEKEKEVCYKKYLDIVSILIKMNLLKPILDELRNHYTFEDILHSFNTKLQDIFSFEKSIDHFYEKYLKIEEALRIPLALVKYVSSLKNNKESSVSQELQRLTIHILEDSVKQERYQVKNNPHLQKIKEGFPKVFRAWQSTQEMVEVIIGKTKQQSLDFFVFLREKILIDNHLPQVPLELAQYLEGKTYSIENMKKTDQQIIRLFQKLCDPSVNVTKKLTILKELSPLIGQNEFKNDIDSLYMNLTKINKQKTVLVLDSDDWQDLFLSGTEVLGSCQRIDGGSSLNVCLMAYVLDGKNRILCIKDPITGKILARCIFRLLWNPKYNQPVLFQERIYPSPCDYEELLNKLAEIRARELGLELFTCNTRDNLSSERFIIESLGSCSPYEYADASTEGKTKGVFRVHMARKVPLPSEKT